MNDLPECWAEGVLDEINDPDRPICYGILMPGPDLPDGVPYVKVRNIRADKVLVDEVHRTSVEIESKFARSRLRTGDLLVSIRGTYGRTASVPAELDGGNITQDTARVAPVGAGADYVRLFMQSPAAQNYFKAVARGVAVKGVNIGDLRKLPVPVAPVAEQERIVAAIDEAFSKLGAGEAGLRTVGHLLKRMRAAVLAAAVTGRLVPQDPTDAPATKLLADLGAGVVDPPAGEVTPSGWAWSLLGDVTEIGGGIQKQPKRAPSRHPVPFLRVANVGRGTLNLDDVHLIEVFDGELARYGLRAGDLLVVEGNGSADQIGRAALWGGAIEPCVHQNHLIRVRPTRVVLPAFLELYWNSPGGSHRVQSVASSTSGLHTLSTGKLKSLPVVVPPVEEQARIVAEVERQLTFLDVCERITAAELTRSAALRRSVLKSAFEGRLVPQDASDEPASVLLDRIRAERASAPKPARRARRTA